MRGGAELRSRSLAVGSEARRARLPPLLRSLLLLLSADWWGEERDGVSAVQLYRTRARAAGVSDDNASDDMGGCNASIASCSMLSKRGSSMNAVKEDPDSLHQTLLERCVFCKEQEARSDSEARGFEPRLHRGDGSANAPLPMMLVMHLLS